MKITILYQYFQSASEAVDIEALDLDSPALRELKAAGVKLAVPLVSQGELIGVLNLGPRLSEQDYDGSAGTARSVPSVPE